MRYAILAMFALATAAHAQERELHLKPIKTEAQERPRSTPAIGQGVPTQNGVPNYGIDPSRLQRHQPGFNAKSDEARRFVMQATQVGEDGGDKLHVTVIGSEADRGAVLDDIRNHPAFKDVRERIQAQGYSPDDWEVDTSLGYMHGKPTILIQSESGRVLWRAMDYSVGPEGVATAIRKADPNYNPDLDPGPNKPNDDIDINSSSRCPLGFGPGSWPMIAVAGVVVLLILKQPRAR